MKIIIQYANFCMIHESKKPSFLNKIFQPDSKDLYFLSRILLNQSRNRLTRCDNQNQSELSHQFIRLRPAISTEMRHKGVDLINTVSPIFSFFFPFSFRYPANPINLDLGDLMTRITSSDQSKNIMVYSVFSVDL